VSRSASAYDNAIKTPGCPLRDRNRRRKPFVLRPRFRPQGESGRRSAITQPAADRRYPRALQLLGALGCAVLVVTLPTTTVLTGLAVFAVGLGYRLVRLRLART